MKVLITGIEGFAGSHLAELLLGEGWEVFGIKHPESSFENIAFLSDSIHVEQMDINQLEQVQNEIQKVEPEAIIHLAAFSRVGLSWQSRTYTYKTNILATANLLEAAAELNAPPRLLMISSAEVYGPLPESRMPIREDCPMNPVNPYAVSKASVELIMHQFMTENTALNWKIVRPFNHTGPRQTSGFVCSDFAQRVAQIEAGIAEPEIKVGNLNALRDFSDVRDIARSYKLLIESDNRKTYNVCSGRAYSIQGILDMLLRMSKIKITVSVDEKKLRPIDTPVIVGDNTRIKEDLGWEPRIPFEKTLNDLLEYWREKINRDKVG
jgi:GDP-4-dehydro-6-deoxy-D-mannose reductase